MDTNDDNKNTQTDVQTENVNKAETNSQAETDKATDTHNKSDNKDEKTLSDKVSKIRDKMASRIAAEAGKKNEYKDKLADANKQIETLTAKLADLDKTHSKQDNTDGNAELDKANKTIKDLRLQLTRRDQISQVDSQFKQAGVTVPQDMLNLLVPPGADDETVSANMKKFSSFYDSVVASVRKSFMTDKTPRVSGSSTKPFDMKDLNKISDPIKRINMIKEHLHDND